MKELQDEPYPFLLAKRALGIHAYRRSIADISPKDRDGFDRFFAFLNGAVSIATPVGFRLGEGRDFAVVPTIIGGVEALLKWYMILHGGMDGFFFALTVPVVENAVMDLGKASYQGVRHVASRLRRNTSR